MQWMGDSYMINRYMCEVLEEMRKHTELLSEQTIVNYKEMMPSLIEEVQTMGNRMEAGLADANDVKTMHEEKAKLRKEIKKLKADKKLLDKDA